jgi:hypothetical protein
MSHGEAAMGELVLVFDADDTLWHNKSASSRS